MLVLLALGTAHADHRCPSDVVGVDRCARYGRWAIRHLPLNDATELGTTVLALAPTDVLRPDGTPATVGGGRHLAAGVHLRALRALGPNIDAGLEIFPGSFVGPSGTATVDGMPVSVGSNGVGHAFVIAGAHVGGDLQVGIELAGGFGDPSVVYGLPSGYTAASRGPFAGLAEARLRGRWWLSRSVTVAASAGTDTHGNRTFGVDVALHFVAFDGR
jgi:hypothetical protein